VERARVQRFQKSPSSSSQGSSAVTPYSGNFWVRRNTVPCRWTQTLQKVSCEKYLQKYLTLCQDTFQKYFSIKSSFKIQDKDAFRKYLKDTRWYTILYFQDKDTIFKYLAQHWLLAHAAYWERETLTRAPYSVSSCPLWLRLLYSDSTVNISLYQLSRNPLIVEFRRMACSLHKYTHQRRMYSATRRVRSDEVSLRIMETSTPVNTKSSEIPRNRPEIIVMSQS